MAHIVPLNDKTPVFGENCWLAPNATVVGDVVMGRDCSIWFGAVVRGDVHWIRMGDGVNVQDGAIIHGTYQTAPTSIGNQVSIGHRAIVHGCTLEDQVLVGMGAIIMDGAVVGRGAMVAAGAVVLEQTRIESGEIWAGVPARRIKQMTQEQFEGLNGRISANYLKYSGWYRADGHGLVPDTRPHSNPSK